MTTITKASAASFVKAGTGGRPRAVLRDDVLSGFALALTKGGSASWWYEYRLPGAGRARGQKTYTIGTWPKVPVEEARNMVRILAGQIAAGVDPQVIKKAEAAKERLLLENALDEYERHLEGRAASSRGRP